MAAAKLVTRCPACRTAFRLVADQLRLRQGLVRCGQCDTVFDAREHLIEVPARPAPAPSPTSPASSAPAASPATAAPSVASSATAAPGAPASIAAALAHAEQAQAMARAREGEAPFDPGFDPGYEVPALDSPTTLMSDADEIADAARAPTADDAAPSHGETVSTEHARDEAAPIETPRPQTTTPPTGFNGMAVDVDDAHALPARDSDIAQPSASDTTSTESSTSAVEARDTASPAAAEADDEVAASFDAHAADAAASSEADETGEAPTAVPPPAPADAAPSASTSSAPWPTLDHSAFDDEPARPTGHSSLDPAAAFAPATPSGLPPAGAYSAKPIWPPLQTAQPSGQGAGFPAPDAAPAGESDISRDTDALAPPQGHTPTAGDAAAAGDDGNPVGNVDHHDTDNGSGDIDSVARAADHADAAPSAHPFPAPEPVRSASGFLRAADPADPEAEAWAAAQAKAGLEQVSDDADELPRDDARDPGTGESAMRHWLRRDTPAAAATGPVFAPDFLRHSRGRAAPRTVRKSAPLPISKRTWMRIAAVVLGLGVIVQGVFLARSQVAGSLPVLRPVLEAACAPFGCEVPPWRDLESLRIDTSQLQKQDEASDVYQLAVTLRNQGRATTALPAIELVMTDLQDQLLLRRVLQPSEYLDPVQRGFAATGLRAGSELPVRVRFRTQQTVANYRVLIFYP
jgi:predicted Zn finger-like uncharacterized protein